MAWFSISSFSNGGSFVRWVQRRFSNLGYLPRWIIICIDVCIVSLASYLTYIVVSNLTLKFYLTYTPLFRYSIVVLVHGIFFLLYRTYAGIIRHSSFFDALKLFFSTFSGFVLLVVFNYVHYFLTGDKVYLMPALIVHTLFTFLMLFSFRVLVKLFFEHYLSGVISSSLPKLLIYGSDSQAVALAHALLLEQPRKYQLIGFVGDKQLRMKQEMLGLPIFSRKQSLRELVSNYEVNALLLADKHLSKTKKIKIVKTCLALDCKVLTAPVINEWGDSKEITKSIKSFKIQDLLERKPIVLDNQEIQQQVSGKVILITGAAGSIGSEIAHQLLSYNPKEILLLDQAESPLHHLCLELSKITSTCVLTPLLVDVRDAALVAHIFSRYQPQLVYHAAAYKHVPLMEDTPYQAIMTNCMGTKHVADMAIRYQAERFVMVSTDKAVNPSNVMGASKRIAEIYVQTLFMATQSKQPSVTKFITTRFGNVLGSNGSVVPLFTKQIEAGGPITLTHPDIIRYFMTIPEACQLVLEAGAMGNGGEIFIFDMGKPVRILDLATKMIRLAGLIPEQDIAIQITGLRPGEKLYEELLYDTSKVLPTHHAKILIAQDLSGYDYVAFNSLMENLCAHTVAFDYEQAVRLMKQMVPEFKSQNSVFERLDG
ncbi:polysaccharide biosynthesis protein [Flavobacterium channae]|uniref:polysaccharide biosynthesis protein n=1 Tax=Flavobacterium channae TaxID=2897181 RepID=UPI001E5B4E87|nr:nucleoside-diphosphate sugar epimerase/dehydratase [Flavobacterium channae]UGS24186.1 polysaccharide biosynthesis protein [Flavobacterium channae]